MWATVDAVGGLYSILWGQCTLEFQEKKVWISCVGNCNLQATGGHGGGGGWMSQFKLNAFPENIKHCHMHSFFVLLMAQCRWPLLVTASERSGGVIRITISWRWWGSLTKKLKETTKVRRSACLFVCFKKAEDTLKAFPKWNSEICDGESTHWH